MTPTDRYTAPCVKPLSPFRRHPLVKRLRLAWRLFATFGFSPRDAWIKSAPPIDTITLPAPPLRCWQGAPMPRHLGLFDDLPLKKEDRP